MCLKRYPENSNSSSNLYIEYERAMYRYPVTHPWLPISPELMVKVGYITPLDALVLELVNLLVDMDSGEF
jgi:hypothetical protein